MGGRSSGSGFHQRENPEMQTRRVRAVQHTEITHGGGRNAVDEILNPRTAADRDDWTRGLWIEQDLTGARVVRDATFPSPRKPAIMTLTNRPDREYRITAIEVGSGRNPDGSGEPIAWARAQFRVPSSSNPNRWHEVRNPQIQRELGEAYVERKRHDFI